VILSVLVNVIDLFLYICATTHTYFITYKKQSMRTFKTLLIVLCLFGFADIAQAQFRIGPSISFGTDTDLGLGVKAKFDLDEKFKISPSFNFLASSSDDTPIGKVKSSVFEINGDVHYAFSDNGNVLFYGLGGLNIGVGSVSVAGSSSSSTDIGLNLGAGGEYVIGEKFNAFTEAKFGIGGVSQLLITAGIYFDF